MKIFLFISLFSILGMLGCKPFEIVGSYQYKGQVTHLLKISPDSTFKLTIKGDLGTWYTEGRWYCINNIVYVKSFDKYKAVRFEEKKSDYLTDSIKLFFYNYDEDSILINHPAIEVLYGNIRLTSEYLIDGEISIKKLANIDTLHIYLWENKYKFLISDNFNDVFKIYINEKNSDFYYLDSLKIRKRNLSLIDSPSFIYKKQ